jgi:hypothetical protein
MSFPDFYPHPINGDWLASSTMGMNYIDAENEARRLQSDALEQGWFAICGFNVQEQCYRVFLAPSDDVMAVARAFGVCSHDSTFDDKVSEEAMEQIGKILMVGTVAPFFADSAGIKLRFLKPISDETIAELQEHLWNIEPMMDDEGSIADYIRDRQEIHLWWD